jgi:signal peptidase II
MKRRYLILFSLSGLVLCFDQWTKHLVHSSMMGEKVVPLLGSVLELQYSLNSGFAFGLLQKAPSTMQDLFFIGVPIFALILIVLIFIKLQDNQMLTSVALTTILGGAVGNLIDRLHYGFVIDFLRIHFGPIALPQFNLADVAIVVGVLLMFISTLSQDRSQALDAS